jgi:hypothetical protein
MVEGSEAEVERSYISFISGVWRSLLSFVQPVVLRELFRMLELPLSCAFPALASIIASLSASDFLLDSATRFEKALKTIGR